MLAAAPWLVAQTPSLPAGPGILTEGTKKLQLLKVTAQQYKAFEERDYL